MTEFDPEASGFAKSREAYQTDMRQVMGLIQTLQGQIKALEGRIVALSSQKPQNPIVEVNSGNSVSGLSQQTLPHNHVAADVTDFGESVMDAWVGQASGSGLAIDYDDSGDSLTLTVETEYVQDIVGAMVVAGSGCTVTYNDGTGQITISVP